ncbi:type II CAAX endopeptidase family protein [Evansella sp. AB-P1]|uniref:CPBP family intramembrane glutamic endopeptidase n=1 Tax=Evansella sp. AB-P1 TaxID=3037653 RepID=UPI00241E4789|nr:type II CAAX endopeptidase family protein [Evansella sp. AB-P1]MDG5785872.1 type II CAAX endopeptidase family protein [Evansella sp. AB-P1]
MSKRYWIILISFIVIQLATSGTAALLIAFGFSGTFDELVGISVAITFSIGFLVILYLTLTAKPDEEFSRNKASVGETILWCILGFFMVYAAQIVANLIQINLFGIEPGSENTQDIVAWATAVPFVIIVVSILVPIMEEIVFRMVIFGSLYKRFGFWIAALSSGFIFALVHFDFQHLIVYMLPGIVFAYLYVKTKRIIVPIMAHVGINSFVMLVQVVFGEDIERILEQMENMQTIIGGLF